MKPRAPQAPRVVSSISASRESIGQPLGKILAFAFFGHRHRVDGARTTGDGHFQQRPTRSQAASSGHAPISSGGNADGSFTFTLSPTWSSGLSATSAKELFPVTRDVVASIALEGGLAAIHPGFQKVLKHREYPCLEIPIIEFLPRNDCRRLHGTKTARALALYFEARYECGDGTSRWLGWNIFSRPHEERLDCIARDITEAKSAADVAHRMQKMFTASGDLLCILDARGRFQLANPAFEKLLGFAAQQLVGTPFADMVYHRDRRNAKVCLAAPTRDEGALFVARCGPGHRRIAWKAVAVPPENLVYCVGRDVSDLRVLQKRRPGSEKVLINLAQLSNDINNPLEAMLNLLFLLRRRELAERDHSRYIDLAEEQVSRIATVLRRIL